MTLSLQEHLDHVMAERAGRGHKGAKGMFAIRLKDDAEMRARAQDRLAYLDGPVGQDIAQRDHITREHLRTLKEALSE